MSTEITIEYQFVKEARHLICNFYELTSRTAREEYTDTGELWDLARDMAEVLFQLALAPIKGEEDLDDYEFVVEAAAKVYGRETILKKPNPTEWLEGQLVGTYANVGDWASEEAADGVNAEIAPYIDWDKYGEYVARKRNLTWVKGGEGIYVFHKEDLDLSP